MALKIAIVSGIGFLQVSRMPQQLSKEAGQRQHTCSMHCQSLRIPFSDGIDCLTQKGGDVKTKSDSSLPVWRRTRSNT